MCQYIKTFLHIPYPSPCPLMSPSVFHCVYDDGQNGFGIILSIKWSVSIDTMIKVDGDIEGDGDSMCKQTLTGRMGLSPILYVIPTITIDTMPNKIGGNNGLVTCKQTCGRLNVRFWTSFGRSMSLLTTWHGFKTSCESPMMGPYFCLVNLLEIRENYFSSCTLLEKFPFMTHHKFRMRCTDNCSNITGIIYVMSQSNGWFPLSEADSDSDC